LRSGLLASAPGNAPA